MAVTMRHLTFRSQQQPATFSNNEEIIARLLNIRGIWQLNVTHAHTHVQASYYQYQIQCCGAQRNISAQNISRVVLLCAVSARAYKFLVQNKFVYARRMYTSKIVVVYMFIVHMWIQSKIQYHNLRLHFGFSKQQHRERENKIRCIDFAHLLHTRICGVFGVVFQHSQINFDDFNFVYENDTFLMYVYIAFVISYSLISNIFSLSQQNLFGWFSKHTRKFFAY